jgi:hypothetical protein
MSSDSEAIRRFGGRKADVFAHELVSLLNVLRGRHGTRSSVGDRCQTTL